MHLRLLAYLVELFGSIILLWPVNAIRWCMAVRRQRGWRKAVLYISALCGIASEAALITTTALFVVRHGTISFAQYRLWIVAMMLYTVGFLMHMNPLDYFMKHLAPKRRDLAEVIIDLRWKHSPFRHKEITV